MRETWYVLDDGTVAHPREVTRDDKGALIHKRGKVQMRGDTPRSRSVELDEPKPQKRPTLGHDKDMKPNEDHGGGYRTRETKAGRTE